jgi:integrase
VWCIQLELPTPPDQTRRQFRRSGFFTRDEAQQLLDEARALLALAPKDPALTLRIGQLLTELPQGQPLPTPQAVARKLRAGNLEGVSIALGDYLDDWLAGREGLSPGTLYAYAAHIRVHLQPHLGHIGIDELRPTHIKAMFAAIKDNNQLLTDARASNDPLVRASVNGKRAVNPPTMHRIRATLRKALADAITVYELIDYNPAVHVELPSGARPRARAWTPGAVKVWKDSGTIPSAVMVWMPDQASAFLDYAETHDIVLYAMYALITVWALRRGEACGLRDIDVDLDAATITIRQQRTAVGYKAIVKDVKTAAGDRVIAIDPHTVKILRSYLTIRAGWKLANGPEWPNTEFFFVRPDGQPWHPDNLGNRFVQLTAEAGLPPIRFHDLRHCAASYLKLAGADMKTIQEVLGHSSSVITSDTYTLLFQDLERAVTAAAANLIHGQRGKKAA